MRALANNGEYSDRTCIRKISHVSDGVIYKDAEEKTQVYSKGAAWMMTDVLKGVFNESYGTARALKLNGGQITAGKTGTRTPARMCGFCGYSAYYTTVVWCVMIRREQCRVHTVPHFPVRSGRIT